MFRRALPTTLDLLSIRIRSSSAGITTHGAGRREVTRGLHWVTQRGRGRLNNPNIRGAVVATEATGDRVRVTTEVNGHRLLSTSSPSWGSEGRSSNESNDPVDYYSNDPQVKEWVKELRKDFSRLPDGGKKKDEEIEVVREEWRADSSSTSKEGWNVNDHVAANNGTQEDVIKEGETRMTPQKKWSQLVAEKYEKLDSYTQVIYDYDEERLRREDGIREEEEERGKAREKVQLERGETGVFDIEELVDLLREDNARDIVVIQVPPEMKYVSYMVIVSSESARHRGALAELVRAAYKLKKKKSDPSLIMEGKGTNWVAMDMGNIALHVMKTETRELYDLETLWAVGAEFDEKAQVPKDELVIGIRQPRTSLPHSTPSPSPAEAVG